MQRPVWLISLDSDTFPAAPMTTGGLKAYYQHYGQQAAATDIQQVHFSNEPQRIAGWLSHWKEDELPRAEAALAEGLQPLMGFSVYTWNAAEFLSLMGQIRELCPGIRIVAGGPHVQKAEDYLFSEAVDLIVMGEGEATFTELLDLQDLDQWTGINGLAGVVDGSVLFTPKRPRCADLDSLPSALDVIDLNDVDGKPYDCIAYETSRGCPYKCAFCEWGTGAIGTKMLSYSVGRIEQDWHKIVAAGIRNLWLSDSNFGALKTDVDKARILCDIKKRTGLPNSFATSWSKKHSPKSQQIVMMLHEHNLLSHYHLALQTLTPLALELSHRTNMDANKYEPIARDMAKARVPIACELIWGLIGDNLTDFEKNLDRLYAVFPTVHIFGYTLLPGTEFYDKREEYEIKTLPVAGYGKAKGEYVVGCFSYPQTEGIEGYFLITAHMLFNRGYMLPMTLRYLALSEVVPVAQMMRAILHALCDEFAGEIPALQLTDNIADKMNVYEERGQLFLRIHQQADRAYACVATVIHQWLEQYLEDRQKRILIRSHVDCLLKMDQVFAPRIGKTRQEKTEFQFDVEKVMHCLEDMELPDPSCFIDKQIEVVIDIPGGVGDLFSDPDGGLWIRGKLADKKSAAQEVIAITA